MRFGSENPVFKSAHFQSDRSEVSSSYIGVASKTTILLGIISLVAIYTANSITINDIPTVGITLILAMLFGIIPVILTHRIPHLAFVFAPLYALLEGYVLGSISALYAYLFGGDIIQVALLSTFGVLAGMLLLYSTGMIRVGGFFKRFMMSLVFGLLLANLLIFILSITGVAFATFEGFYFAVIVISVIAASLFLLIDFDRITNYVNAGVPKNREWSLSLGLVTTIVWLYLEILRFLAFFARNN